MTYETILSTTKRELIQTFAILDSWFDSRDIHQPHAGGKWNTIQLLHHIASINHQLIELIDHSVEVNEHANELSEKGICNILSGDFYALDVREGDHHQPVRSENELCAELRWQLYRCLLRLKEFEALPAQGFRKDSNSGMIFYYIYFLVEHVKRHLELADSFENKYEEQLL